MPRIEIGIGGVIAALAGLGWGSYLPVNIALLVFGFLLIINGAYDIYYKPNVGLDKTLGRWLERHYWKVVSYENAASEKFYFTVWVQDTANRRVMISRERSVKGILAFTAPIELDQETRRGIGTLLDKEQKQLYEDLHILLASMHLGYNTPILTNMSVQHALPIDENLSEHAVDLKAKEVADGVAAARSLVRRALT